MAKYSKGIMDIQNTLQKLESSSVYMGRVYKKVGDQKVLGGLIEDSELEIKIVQTSLLKNANNQTINNMSRILSP